VRNRKKGNCLVELKKFCEFASNILGLVVNIRAWGPFNECYKLTRFDYAFQVSWSQSGEDIVLRDLITSNESSKFYVDVGAHHPSRFSVTRHLYQIGWKGLNVDANQGVSKIFRMKRPRDVFLNYAVGIKREYELFSGNETAVSTTNLAWKKTFESQGMSYTQSYRVNGLTLREILDHPSCPERVAFLNIDIEGSDFEALISGNLEQLSSNRWPDWIMVESTPPVISAQRTESVNYLQQLGYEMWLQLPFVTLLRSPYNHEFPK
jgi:FkbM family methyltransferase